MQYNSIPYYLIKGKDKFQKHLTQNCNLVLKKLIFKVFAYFLQFWELKIRTHVPFKYELLATPSVNPSRVKFNVVLA